MRRLETIESELGDLVPDVQSLGRYEDITSLAWCLQTVKRLRKRYRKRADGITWSDDDD